MFKSITIFPPGGWQFYQVETKWTAPKGLTFDGLVRKIQEHRLGNPRFKLITDAQSIIQEVHIQNGKRINFNPQYWSDELAKKKLPGFKVEQPSASVPQSGRFQGLVRLVSKIRQTAKGAEVLSDWLGDGGIPVAREIAESRATVCEKCPLNEKGDWMDKVTGEIAERIKDQLEVKAGLDLELPNEEALGTCGACGCHLSLKAWVPNPFIRETMSEEDQTKLDPDCWIPREKYHRLLLVIPFCQHDYNQALALLDWINELGGCPNNPCLLVADCKIKKMDLENIARLGNKSFPELELITTPHSLPNERWPLGPNWMWQTALRHVYNNYENPFFWCEPDCIPLRPHWLQILEVEYNACGKPFMGAIVSSSGQPNLPPDHLTGCAIYPQNAHTLLQHVYKDNRAFDMAMASTVVPLTHHTELHQHFWGQMNLAPVFRGNRSKDNPPNTLLRGTVRSDAVVFHRCKDGSLIELLRMERVTA